MPPRTSRRKAPARSELKPAALRGFMAHRALMALSHGYKLRVVIGSGKSKQIHEGFLRGVANDWAPQMALEKGGSNLALLFRDGRTIPLEQVSELGRAGD